MSTRIGHVLADFIGSTYVRETKRERRLPNQSNALAILYEAIL